jgi:hypothetical protein
MKAKDDIVILIFVLIVYPPPLHATRVILVNDLTGGGVLESAN